MDHDLFRLLVQRQIHVQQFLLTGFSPSLATPLNILFI